MHRLDYDAVDEETVVPWVEEANGVTIASSPERRKVLLSSGQGQALPDPLAK
jgi:hypothetical protein